MINTNQMTEEQKSINRKNHYQRKKELKVKPGYVLHHKDVNMRFNDIDRYIEWRPEDLVVLSLSEHTTLHNKARDMSLECYNFYKTQEYREKLSKAIKAAKNKKEQDND